MKSILISICFFFLSLSANATHVMGGEFSYSVWDSTNRIYKIHLSLYRDCSGITPGNASWTVKFSNGCPTMTLNANLLGKKEITPLCAPFPKTLCTDKASTLKGMEIWEYEWVGQFPPGCGIATVTWVECCRNVNTGPGSIDPSIIDPMSNSVGATIKTEINLGLKRGNNSSTPLSNNSINIEENKPFIYNFSNKDIDGDSLVYSLYSLYSSFGTPDSLVVYKPPYSYLRPFDMVEPSIAFNAKTGQMKFTPTKVQTSILGVKVMEYRKLKSFSGSDSFVYAGAIYRDLQYSVSANATNGGIIKSGIDTGSLFNATNFALNALSTCKDTIAFDYHIFIKKGTKNFINYNLLDNAGIFTVSQVKILDMDTTNQDTIVLSIKNESWLPIIKSFNKIVIEYSYCLNGVSYKLSDAVTVQKLCPTIFSCNHLNPSYTFVAINNTVNFTNTSITNLSPVQYTWLFGDGTFSNDINPIKTYGSIGTYSVTLRIKSLIDTTCIKVITKLVSVYGTPPGLLCISGRVKYNNSTNIPDAVNLWLIKYDNVTNQLSAVQTLTTTAADTGKFIFCNIAPGNYRVKAAMNIASNAYLNYIPTYFGNSLLWNLANVLAVPNVNINRDIIMVAGLNPGGPGFVAGNIFSGANKMGGIGQPEPNVQVILKDKLGNGVAYTFSDEKGNYSFPDIELGEYTVVCDLLNKTSAEININLTSANMRMTNQNFEVRKLDIIGASSEIIQVNAIEKMSIFPNPANDKLHIDFVSEESRDAQILILNQLGQIQHTMDYRLVNGLQSIELDVSAYANGIYTVKFIADNRVLSNNKFIVLK